MSDSLANSAAEVSSTSGSEGGAPPSGSSLSTIDVTAKAVNEIKRIKSSDPTATNSNLRVQVVGGGCSGMSYKLGFDNQPPAPNDKVFEKDGVKIICDSKSFLFLSGTTLDFSDGLNGTGFVFNNPNAKRTCGCGSSFSA